MRALLSVPLLGSLFLVLLLDQISKVWVLRSIAPHSIIEVVPGCFNFTLTFNSGIAFGMFSSMNSPWRELLIGGAVLTALVTVLFFHVRYYKNDRIAQLAIGAVLGGALGNVLDRFRIGQVVDFLDFYIGSSHWPAFNIADSAVCLGVFLLLLRPVHEEHNPDERDDAAAVE